MAVFNRMEDGLMDPEERDALGLSKDDLLAMAAKGKKARVARRKPFRMRGRQDSNQLAAAIVAEATGEAGVSFPPAEEMTSIVIDEVRIRPERPVSFPTHQSVTITP